MIKKTNWRKYDETKIFVQSLNLSSIREWKEYCKSGKKPDDIPTRPERTYKKEWKNWPDWLGNDRIADQLRTYCAFSSARKFVHSLGLKNHNEWKKYCKSGKKPDDIPTNPHQTYATKGWKGIPDWLGNGNLSNKDRKYVTYNECVRFARRYKITTQKEWENFCATGKRPDHIPSHPDREYKKEGSWKGWPKFCGTTRIANQNKKFPPFNKARDIVHSLKIKTQKEYQKASIEKKLPTEITSAPWKIYKNKGWKNWPDWLGNENIANQTKSKNYLPWHDAKKEIQKLSKEYGLKNSSEWTKFTKTHKKLLEKIHLPTEPWTVYTKERVWKKMKND